MIAMKGDEARAKLAELQHAALLNNPTYAAYIYDVRSSIDWFGMMLGERTETEVEFALKASGLNLDENMRAEIKREASLKLQNAMQKVMTPYEDPLLYMRLQELQEDIAKSTNDIYPDSKFDIPVTGTLPTGRVNAVATSTKPSGEYLLIFEHGLFEFTQNMSKALVQCLEYQQDRKTNQIRLSLPSDGTDALFSKKPELLSNIRTILYTYIKTGKVSGNNHIKLSPAHKPTIDMLRYSMQYFVVGHEYGHLINGDLQSAEHSFSLVGDGLRVEEIRRNHISEYKADAVGVSLTINSMQRRWDCDVAYAYFGSDVFLSIIGLLYRSISMLLFGTDVHLATDTHPTPRQRQDSLRTALGKVLGKQEFNSCITEAEKLNALIESTYGFLRYELSTQQIPVAPMWRNLFVN
jgi:hypothetical protein